MGCIYDITYINNYNINKKLCQINGSNHINNHFGTPLETRTLYYGVGDHRFTI